MFTVVGCLVLGIIVGYLFRQKKMRVILRIILALIWLLLFLLGLELGSNDNVVSQFGKLGLEALLLAVAATFGSVVFAWLLWCVISKKTINQ